MAYACTFLPDMAKAEDIVHGVFVKILKGHVAPETPAAYLYRAVRNEALNARRNGWRETQLEECDGCFTHRYGNQEAALALQKALSELPEEQREVVIMRIWGGMTLEEVAEETRVSLNTVASRYRYALEKLRDRLKPHQERTQEEGTDG